MKSAVRKNKPQEKQKEKNHPCERESSQKTFSKQRCTKNGRDNPTIVIYEEDLKRLRIPYECLFNW